MRFIIVRKAKPEKVYSSLYMVLNDGDSVATWMGLNNYSINLDSLITLGLLI
jgi:hypothetical protein